MVRQFFLICELKKLKLCCSFAGRSLEKLTSGTPDHCARKPLICRFNSRLHLARQGESLFLKVVETKGQDDLLHIRGDCCLFNDFLRMSEVCPWATFHLQLIICEERDSAYVRIPQNQPSLVANQNPILHFIICEDVSG